MRREYLRHNCQSLVRGDLWCCIRAADWRCRGIAYIAGRKGLFKKRNPAELNGLVQLEENASACVASLTYEEKRDESPTCPFPYDFIKLGIDIFSARLQADITSASRAVA